MECSRPRPSLGEREILDVGLRSYLQLLIVV